MVELISERELDIFNSLRKAVINGDEEAAKKAAEDAVAAKIDPVKAITDGLVTGMAVIGEKFRKFECFLPEVILAADAMKAGMATLKPRISAKKLAEITLGKVVIGTVSGDIHDIGKNFVSAMLELAGFEVFDVGNDCPPERFIEKAKEVEADIIALSSLITTSMPFQKDVIDLLKDMNLRKKFHVIVGGGPVTPKWAESIGADGYGRLASDAVDVAKILMSEKKVTFPVIED